MVKLHYMSHLYCDYEAENDILEQFPVDWYQKHHTFEELLGRRPFLPFSSFQIKTPRSSPRCALMTARLGMVLVATLLAVGATAKLELAAASMLTTNLYNFPQWNSFNYILLFPLSSAPRNLHFEMHKVYLSCQNQIVPQQPLSNILKITFLKYLY